MVHRVIYLSNVNEADVNWFVELLAFSIRTCKRITDPYNLSLMEDTLVLTEEDFCIGVEPI